MIRGILIHYYQGNTKACRWEALLPSVTSSTIVLEEINPVSHFWVSHTYGYLEELEALWFGVRPLANALKGLDCSVIYNIYTRTPNRTREH